MSSMEPNAKCECGAEVIHAINLTFPGMGVVVDPEPHPAGTWHVGKWHTGQRFARRHTSTDGDGPRWVAHRATCPLPQPRRAS